MQSGAVGPKNYSSGSSNNLLMNSTNNLKMTNFMSGDSKELIGTQNLATMTFKADNFNDTLNSTNGQKNLFLRAGQQQINIGVEHPSKTNRAAHEMMNGTNRFRPKNPLEVSMKDINELKNEENKAQGFFGGAGAFRSHDNNSQDFKLVAQAIMPKNFTPTDEGKLLGTQATLNPSGSKPKFPREIFSVGIKKKNVC